MFMWGQLGQETNGEFVLGHDVFYGRVIGKLRQDPYSFFGAIE